jgi:hypothetical protein
MYSSGVEAHVPMPGGNDEVEKGVDSVVFERWLAHNPTINSENIIILHFKKAVNLSKTVSIVSKTQQNR